MTAAPSLFYWSEFFWPFIGGIETFSRAFLPRLAARGYRVYVLTEGDGVLPAEEDMEGVTIHRLPLRSALDSGDLGRVMETMQGVRALKQRIAPDIVHVNFSGPMAFYHLKTLRAAPAAATLTTIHVALDELRGGPGTLLGDILTQATWITANSGAVLEDIHAAAPETADRSSVIYCGVDAEELAGPRRPASAPNLLYVGRLVSVKGVDLAIAAFAAIRREFPGATLTIAGDGPERAALGVQVLEAGLGASVTFTGWVEPAGIPALMASATLVLVPSRWREAFGLVSLEAALQARPVVGAAVGGIREIVDHGVTGVLVPKDDAGALARAAISLLSDPDGLAVMGRRARQRAEQVFGVEANLEAFDRLYRRLAAAG